MKIYNIIRPDSPVKVLISNSTNYCNINTREILALYTNRSASSQNLHNFTFHCLCNKLYRATPHSNLYTARLHDKDLNPLHLRCSQKEQNYTTGA